MSPTLEINYDFQHSAVNVLLFQCVVTKGFKSNPPRLRDAVSKQ